MNEEKRTELLKKYPLQTLYFYLTGDCNLACRHCWIAPRFQNALISQSALNYDLFTSIINEAKPLGLTSVKLTGGEPLLHPRIADMLSFIGEEDLGLTIESNGTVLTPGIASQIAANKHPFLTISLDGSNAEIHEWVRGVPGCFERTLRGIGFAVDAGIKPQLIMTLMRQNVHQIESMIELAERLGAGSVKINILQPSGRGMSINDQGENLTIGELISIGSRIEEELSENTPIPLFYSHPHGFRPMGRMFQHDCSCGTCRIHHILGVLHNGSYALCGIGQTFPEMVFGNAGRDRLADVWFENPTLQGIRRDLPSSLRGVCQQCVMKHLCLGSCVALNYALTKDLLSPFWYCETAKGQGLFPPTRLTPLDE